MTSGRFGLLDSRYPLLFLAGLCSGVLLGLFVAAFVYLWQKPRPWARPITDTPLPRAIKHRMNFLDPKDPVVMKAKRGDSSALAGKTFPQLVNIMGKQTTQRELFREVMLEAAYDSYIHLNDYTRIELLTKAAIAKAELRPPPVHKVGMKQDDAHTQAQLEDLKKMKLKKKEKTVPNFAAMFQRPPTHIPSYLEIPKVTPDSDTNSLPYPMVAFRATNSEVDMRGVCSSANVHSDFNECPVCSSSSSSTDISQRAIHTSSPMLLYENPSAVFLDGQTSLLNAQLTKSQSSHF